MGNLNWQRDILPKAKQIVLSYDTGVTLRQLFYRLVSIGLIPNTNSMYTSLSRTTADARRKGEFPKLVDKTINLEKLSSYKNPEDAIHRLVNNYRVDRTEGQEYQIFITVEKAGLLEQLKQWYSKYGVTLIAFGGYSSETLQSTIRKQIYKDGRNAVLIYGGDLDPTGEDIIYSFARHMRDDFYHMNKVGLFEPQVGTYNLQKMPGKKKDTRNKDFKDKYGDVFQVEIDALDPNELKGIYDYSFKNYFNPEAYKECLQREEEEKEQLKKKFGL